jgi:carbon monoxide dehydrogenase subunit G
MAMTMTGDIQLHANREAVWAKLNDPAVLKSCIPGCEQLDMLSDSEFQAVATVKVGPVKTRWKGKVRLSDFDPPNSYRISGEGDGGVAGFAKGAAKVSLADKDGGTLLSYNVESQIGGKLAQLGQRLINSAAKKTADDFFEKFRAAVATDSTATSTQTVYLEPSTQQREHNESAYHTHSDHDGSIVLRNCPFVWPLSLRLRM